MTFCSSGDRRLVECPGCFFLFVESGLMLRMLSFKNDKTKSPFDLCTIFKWDAYVLSQFLMKIIWQHYQI